MGLFQWFLRKIFSQFDNSIWICINFNSVFFFKDCIFEFNILSGLKIYRFGKGKQIYKADSVKMRLISVSQWAYPVPCLACQPSLGTAGSKSCMIHAWCPGPVVWSSSVQWRRQDGDSQHFMFPLAAELDWDRPFLPNSFYTLFTYLRSVSSLTYSLSSPVLPPSPSTVLFLYLPRESLSSQPAYSLQST